jgi:hypothetical protein
MSEGVKNLSEAREVRRMVELLNRLDEAVKAEGIEPDSTLGICFATLRAGLEWGDADRREHRAWLATFAAEFEDRQLRLIEDAREVADTYKAASEDECATRDRIARKAEADLKHRQLELHDAVQETLGRLIPQMLDAVKEGNVIRAIAFNRALYARHIAAGVTLVFVVLGLAFGAGRTSKADPPPPAATSEAQ